jgi:exopolyphosphatase/guanosine-5'-triphosphate,3'-diphosphate pyrophosphatase
VRRRGAGGGAEGDRTRRTAVIDLGSNTFRLVVFSAVPGEWWKRTDEIYEPVRIGEGMDASGALGAEPIQRALRTLSVFEHFCRATGIEDVRPLATSAIRDATNRDEFLSRATRATGLQIRVLEREEEAFYGYLAAVNSTTLADGAVLDLGGGSMQLVGVRERRAAQLESWPLGTVRMTERFLPGDRSSKKDLRALRDHALSELDSAPWLAEGERRLVGIGGTVRNLAAAAQRAAGLPSFGVQGFELQSDALDALIAELADRRPGKRGDVPGIKPARADVILAGAVVVRAALEAGGFDAIEVTEEGLREGVFFETHLAPADPPLFADVRDASVRNLGAQYRFHPAHVEHVAALALQMWDALAAGGLHGGDPAERELLWAAAMLHDIGVTVDYDDHHKHSRYLILNGGLPGWSPRETALIAQIARYHRKGEPALGELEPLTRDGDAELLDRCAALLRLAEQLERSRDQIVTAAHMVPRDGTVSLELAGGGDVAVARWAAERERSLFERAFGRELEVAVQGSGP